MFEPHTLAQIARVRTLTVAMSTLVFCSRFPQTANLAQGASTATTKPQRETGIGKEGPTQAHMGYNWIFYKEDEQNAKHISNNTQEQQETAT